MRRWIPLALLSLFPIGASAQGVVVGNTLMADPALVMIANGKGHSGKGHGRGGGAPSPSPAPSAAPAPADGRGESSYSFQSPQPLRVQIEGPTVTHPSITWPSTQPVDVPSYTVHPASGAGWLAVPVQVLYRPSVQPQATQYPAPPARVSPACPIGCEPTPLPQRQAPMICNAVGQCIPWP
ncbi:MAG TPA: hypothetical protein VJ301_18890 [Propionibacteriaceae bacterium]|nr:hypothetical protein [Propionibacteriaceae bacterium]